MSHYSGIDLVGDPTLQHQKGCTLYFFGPQDPHLPKGGYSSPARETGVEEPLKEFTLMYTVASVIVCSALMECAKRESCISRVFPAMPLSTLTG